MTTQEKIDRWLAMTVVCVGTPSEEGIRAVLESIERQMDMPS